ncbi:MAG: GntR family transcriptional regulator, partial [Clostridia bacterium]|nr:GntR family transcriptional regulator [Clostridia bacterium]
AKGGIPIIVVDLRNPKPIYEQIKDNVKQLIISGALKQDEKLPSVRELAQTTSINPNTIRKAYRDLESEGSLYTVTCRGNFVAPSPKHASPKRVEELYTSLKAIVSELFYLGQAKADIIGLLDEVIPKGGTP